MKNKAINLFSLITAFLLLISACSSLNNADIVQTETDVENVNQTSAVPTESSAPKTDDAESTVNEGPDITFTEEDMELQAIIAEIVDKARDYSNLFAYGFIDYISEAEDDEEHEKQIRAALPEPFGTVGYHIISDTLPKTCDELRDELGNYYTESAVERFMIMTAKCEITEVGEEVTTLSFIDGEASEILPIIIEIDGRLYHSEGTKSNGFGDWTTARVKSRTENEIVFYYSDEVYSEIFTGVGRIRNEDGWKFDWDMGEPIEIVE